MDDWNDDVPASSNLVPATSVVFPRPAPKHYSSIEDVDLEQELATQLAEATGYSAVYLRRTIKRPPREEQLPKYEQRKKLVAIRKLFLNSLRHLPIHEIVKQGHVSQSTACRIKKGYHEPKNKPE